MAIVTVSRTHGSGGTILAKAAAERLGYSLYGSELLEDPNRLAKNHFCTVSPEEPEHPSFLERFEELMTNRNFYKVMLFACVYDLALKGDVVFVGMGTHLILEDLPNAMHLRVIRRLSDRVRAIAQVKNVSYDEALDLIEKMDHGKGEFLSHYFDKDAEEATYYHLVLNGSRIPLDYAVDVVQSYVTGRISSPEMALQSEKILARRLLEKKAEMLLFGLDMVHDFGKVVFEAGEEGVLLVRGVVGGEQGKQKLFEALEGLEGVKKIEDHLKVGVLSHIIY